MSLELPHNKDIIYFAKTHYRNTEKIFGIQRQDRRQHMYVLGKSGMGKSTLLSNMLLQDIRNGEGVCVVDPHGELVEELLGVIPKERINDVVYFNPSDIDYHVGFNVLEVPDPRYKHLVASGIMGIFTKIWANVWSSRMEYIMNNCILALIDTPGTTLLGIQRMLVDKDYRQKIVNNIEDPVVRTFWVHEYEAWEDRYRKEAIAPIQNKVGQFLSSSIIRNILGQAKSTIDIPDIMNNKKIFLVNLSKGRVGEDNSALLGAMLITKIQLAAMGRVKIAEHDRKDFYLYVDEFQNFVTDSFATILSEARKYRLNLIVAHQYIAQLESDGNTVVRDAIFGNVGTMLVGRVGAADAAFLETEFMPEFTPDDFVSLPNHHIYLKLLVNGMITRPFSAKTLPPIAKFERNLKVEEYITDRSRKLYHRPRKDVENEISRWSNAEEEGASVEVDENGLGADGKYRAPCSFDDCDRIAVVPFKPERGRPVYCRDCVAKIKAGEKKPITKGGEGGKPMPRKAAQEALASLGIEFTPTKEAREPKKESPPKRERRPEKPRPARKKKPRPNKKPVKTMTKPPKKNNFKPSPKQRTAPDREGLQNIIKDALKDVDFGSAKETPAPAPQAETKPKNNLASLSLKELAQKGPKVESVDLEEKYRANGEQKAPEIGKPRFDPTKQASGDKVSALRAALEKAKPSTPEPVEAPAPIQEEKPATPPPAPEPTPAPAKKEVPEGILRKILADDE